MKGRKQLIPNLTSKITFEEHMLNLFTVLLAKATPRRGKVQSRATSLQSIHCVKAKV